ncbi:DUF2306 domain-containing protein [Zafaria sp. J156]|uniref:DUF2306 domain-containing protein n=1 Tax=Zafaria sp. J156 TaxID=3116490 RepID=UPI003D359DE9
MTQPVVYLHAVAAAYVLVLGPFQLLRRRRDRLHRAVGRSWVAAMAVVCVSSFWIGHGFSWLHVLALWTLFSVGLGVFSILRGNVPAHRYNMLGSYLGTVAAFGFATAVPGRSIPELAAQYPATLGIGVAVVLATAAALVATFRAAPALTPPPAGRQPDRARTAP